MRTASGAQRPAWVLHLTRIAIVLAAAAGGTVFAQSVNVSVPGTSNPYLSGMPNGSTCCIGDSAPAQSPVQVVGLPITPGTTLNFSATGSVTYEFPTIPAVDPPDGGFLFSTLSSTGISGATWTSNSLVGVFLDNNQPDGTPAPSNLDFSGAGVGTNFTTLSPALKQAFFIGDGRTGTGSGAVQRFIIPAGATRLFLGVSDGQGWFNNAGAFNVTISIAAPVASTPATVPTLSLPMLAVLAVVLGGAALVYLRRRA